MDWNVIKIFTAVAHSRNLVAAATSLGMSHSTIYRRLNDFEEEVGRLFERLNGNYELTELGENMLVRAQHITHSFEDIERDIVGMDTQLKGVVRITAPSSFSYHILPNYIAKFNEKYPDIHIELLVTNLELNMTNRHADIAIRVTSKPPEHLVGREVRRIKWGAYASQNYLDKFGQLKQIEDLEQHSLIGAAGSLRSHKVFLELDQSHSFAIQQRTDDLVAMSSMACSGLGIAILPDDLAQPGLERLFTYEQGNENQLWVLTHPDLRKVARIKEVMRFLNDVLSSDTL